MNKKEATRYLVQLEVLKKFRLSLHYAMLPERRKVLKLGIKAIQRGISYYQGNSKLKPGMMLFKTSDDIPSDSFIAKHWTYLYKKKS